MRSLVTPESPSVAILSVVLVIETCFDLIIADGHVTGNLLQMFGAPCGARRVKVE